MTDVNSLLAQARALSVEAGPLAGHGFRFSDLEKDQYSAELLKTAKIRPKKGDQAGEVAKAFASTVLSARALEQALPGPRPLPPGPPKAAPLPRAVSQVPGEPRALNLQVVRALPPNPTPLPPTQGFR